MIEELRDRADHFQIIRTDIQIQFLTAGIDDFVIFLELVLIIIDHLLHFCMLFLCSAKGHVLKGRQGLFQKLTVDLVCRDGLINSDQLKDQVIVGCDRLFTGSCILDGSQNIIRRNIISALCKIALQNSGIFST